MGRRPSLLFHCPLGRGLVSGGLGPALFLFCGIGGRMSTDECFQILGVPSDATQEQIHQAYRDLSKVWHPDRFGDDLRLRQKADEQLKQINAAYAALKRRVGERNTVASTKQKNDTPPPEKAKQGKSEDPPKEQKTTRSSAHGGEPPPRASGHRDTLKLKPAIKVAMLGAFAALFLTVAGVAAYIHFFKPGKPVSDKLSPDAVKIVKMSEQAGQDYKAALTLKDSEKIQALIESRDKMLRAVEIWNEISNMRDPGQEDKISYARQMAETVDRQARELSERVTRLEMDERIRK